MTQPAAATPTTTTYAFLDGGGATGEQLRTLDWANTAVGQPGTWPQSLKMAVGMLLPCSAPVLLWWGPALTLIYNDALAQILGDQYPASLGASAADVRAQTATLAGQVLSSGVAVASHELCFVINRHGYEEETFFSFSYSPLRDARGAVVGVWAPVTETTPSVISRRRLHALRELAVQPDIRNSQSVIDVFMQVLAGHALDIPFAVCYRMDDTRQTATRVGLTGVPADSAFAPATLDQAGCWPEALQLSAAIAVNGLAARFGEQACQPWQQTPQCAVVLPVRLAGWQGALVCGVSPRLMLDADYRTWFDLIASQLGNALSHALMGTSGPQLALDMAPQEPVWVPPTAGLAEIPPALPGADLVVVADDNAELRLWLGRVLFGAGYEVVLASSGSEALQLARQRTPHMIVSDVMMPGVDGISLLQALRADPALQQVPVILLSARPDEETRLDHAGAEDYLLKPFNGRQLLARVRNILSLVHARKAAANALRQSEQRFREVADAAPVMIWVSDEAGLCTWFNRPWLAFTGRDLTQELGHGWTNGVHADDLARYVRVYTNAIKTREAFRMDYRLRRADGEFRVIEDHGVPHINSDGRFQGFIGSCVDVTRTRMSEEAQRRLNETLEVRVQARTEELAASYRSLLTQIQERERVETTLRQMQRLEAVGQLTAGFAHDFNNLLTVVLANARLLDRSLTGDPGKRRVEMIRSAAERGARLVAQLLAFARRQKLEPHRVDLNETLGSMADLLQSTLGGMNMLELAFSDALAPAMVDVTQLELVVLNLAINARDAMPQGGTLRIATGNASIDAERGSQMALAVGDYVHLAVSDTGTGMPPEVVAQAFEPFFTTKEVGKGSGLGLAQVYGFARQSGGTVTITTAEGIGTTFTVYLPAAHEAEAPSLVVNLLPGSAPAPSIQQRVLVVDDDEAVREVTVAVLQDVGYSVVQTADGTVALELVASNDDIDLLVADFAMPGMNGAELARRARILQPGLPVLFVTGYADQVLLADFSADQIMQKPFQPHELVARVGRMLGRGRVV